MSRVPQRIQMLRRYAGWLRRSRTQSWRPWPANLASALKSAVACLGPGDVIVQIGANDGVSGDPLYAHVRQTASKAVLVEPVPELFRQLCETYRDSPNVLCINAAVAPVPGKIPFYVVDNAEGNFPTYFCQLGSFHRGTIEKQRRDYPNIDDYIVEIEVNVLDFAGVMKTAKVSKASLIHTDIEGLDADVLNSIDFDSVEAKVVLFEHVHLDRTAYRELIEKLSCLGFRLRDCGSDTLAVR